MHWDAGNIELLSGDLLLAYTDGITELENEFGEFGEARFLQLALENRFLPLTRISGLVIAAVHGWIGAREQPDDIALVLARAGC